MDVEVRVMDAIDVFKSFAVASAHCFADRKDR
jgi:hypothetical protein